MRLYWLRTVGRYRAERLSYTCFGGGAILFAFALFVMAGYSPTEAQGLGGLTVTPTRIVFEGRQQSAEVILVNTTSMPSTYRISFKNMRMNEDGSYEDIDSAQSGEFFADQMIRYSPRQISLEPGVSQTVRLVLRKPPELQPGEYRSHLLFQSIPPETAGKDIEKQDLQEGEIRVQISTIFAITIPVIVRQGDLSASVNMSDLALYPSQDTNSSAVLSFRLNRTGNRSVSGEVKVTFKSDMGGKEQIVGLANGLAVLSPYPTRVVRLPLKVAEGVFLKNGRLHVVYSARPEEGGAVLAEADLRVP